MSANIFGARFMGSRKPAWHRIGTVFQDPLTATEAIQQADMGFEVHKHPLQAIVPAGPFGQQLVDVPNRFALLREPTQDDNEYRCFGVVGPTYQPVQTADVARLLDPLTKSWPVETVGALGYGETVFITLATGAHSIKGEDLQLFYLFTDTRDGGSALQMAFTPVRVVCQNTLLSGLRQSVVNVSLSHHRQVERELEYRVNLMRQMQDVQNRVLGSFDKLAEAVLLPHNVDEILKLVYPEPARPRKAQLVLDELDADERAMLPGEIVAEADDIQHRFEYYANLAQVRRNQVRQLFGQFNDEFPQTAGSAWALYNAVVENEDFRDGPETLFESALFGKRAATKRKAYDLCLTAANDPRTAQDTPTRKPGRTKKA